MEAITRLRQTSIVALYKTQFEVISNRLKGLPDKYKLSCFLSGLKDEITLPLKLLSPLNLDRAFAMAQMQESVLNFRKTSKFSSYKNLNLQNYQNQSLTKSIKKLLERSEKCRKGEQAAKEYEDEILEGKEMDFQEPEEEQKSVEQREIKEFQEPENSQKGRNILFEERRTIEKLDVFGEKIQEETIGQIKNDEILEPSPRIESMEMKKEYPTPAYD